MGLLGNIFRSKKEQVQLFYKTDIHCHILPGVDHGSQSIEQSLDMLRAEKQMGIERVILTSHVTAITFENTRETLMDSFLKLKDAVTDIGLDIELALSAEYRMDEYFDKEYAADHLIPMPGNHILLENSFQQELMNLDDLLFDMQVKGYKTILAHPERYSYYSRRRKRYEQLHNAGARFQVNILSFTGYFGEEARESALWFVRNGMIDYLGSDMHNVKHAHIIMDYLNSKEWRRLSKEIEPMVKNDLIAF
jgi:tyrosine-protein phosphatase YwqE